MQWEAHTKAADPGAHVPEPERVRGRPVPASRTIRVEAASSLAAIEAARQSLADDEQLCWVRST